MDQTDASPHGRGASRAPDISFIMAAFNAAPYVESAIRSALQQRDVDVEVIVVDDASSDHTARIVAALAAEEPRVILLRRQRRGGASVARNTAIDMARGSWMAILDADDLVAPLRSRCLLDLAAATSADMVADNFERFGSNDRTPGATMIDRRSGTYLFFVDAASFFRGNAMFDRRGNLGYIKPMFRASFVRTKGIRHIEDMYIGEDYHFCLSCLLEGARFVVTSETFYKYRVRSGSLSWRLEAPHVQRLLRAHEELEIQKRFGNDSELEDAAATYANALRRAAVLTASIDDARSGRWWRAVRLAAVHPEAWALLLRFGAEAIRKRLTRPR